MVYNARRITRSSFPDMENNVAEAINRQSIENILSITVRIFTKEISYKWVYRSRIRETVSGPWPVYQQIRRYSRIQFPRHRSNLSMLS